ncbi:MAG: DUF4390 domain-containing protein [Rhodoferax sp.]|nr:DUF4390 domain-containing protein [Rhodoferax sp.]
MTDSSTPCWKSVRRERLAAWLLSCLLFVFAAVPAVRAQDRSEVTQLRLERTPDGLVLYANVRLELPPAVQDALTKGIAMVFLAEADVVRHRWYWTDKKMASVQRHMRLAYHPLTQRWRLNVASGPMTPNSLGLALNLNFDTMEEALATMQRISGWKIADAGMIESDSTLKVDFRFGLDVTQLPRPFQIGAFGQSDWKVGVSASQQIGPEGAR